MTDPTTALREVLALSEKATRGKWFTGHLCQDDHSCSCPYIYSEGQYGMGAIATVGTTEEEVQSEDEAKANQAIIAAAVNLIRRHGPALLSALEDARRLDWMASDARMVWGHREHGCWELPALQVESNRDACAAEDVRAAIDAAIAEGEG